jgi:hypothetical protein
MIPVSLDAGTDNEALRSDPLYLGNRHARRGGRDYDAFLKRYVEAVSRLFPGALLHFEAFGPDNARKILQAYGHGYRVFTDDVQGTGTIVLAAVYAGIRVSGIPMKHQTVVVFGAGATGVAIADQLHDAIVADGATDRARSQIWLVGRQGLLFDDMDDLRHFQRRFARKRSDSPWASRPAPMGLTRNHPRSAAGWRASPLGCGARRATMGRPLWKPNVKVDTEACLPRLRPRYRPRDRIGGGPPPDCAGWACRPHRGASAHLRPPLCSRSPGFT